MSPANVYKFFPSREAIVEASVEINLAVLQSRILEAVRQARKPAGKREATGLAMIREQKETLRNERQFHKLVLMATENNWSCIRVFLDSVVATLAEVIAEGNRTRDFHVGNVRETAQLLFDCLQSVVNPLLTQDIEQAEVERSEERRVGKEGVRTCRSRWSTYH